jgi:hypothetical protein
VQTTLAFRTWSSSVEPDCGDVQLGAVLPTVTELDARVPLTVPSFGVASAMMTSPFDGLIVAGGVGPVQLEVENVVESARVTDRLPAEPDELVSVLTTQVLAPRVTFHVQATETLSPSASAVVVDAVSVSLVCGETGLKVGLVAVGAVFAGAASTTTVGSFPSSATNWYVVVETGLGAVTFSYRNVNVWVFPQVFVPGP